MPAVQTQTKLRHCYSNKARDWGLHPCPVQNREGGTTDGGFSLQTPNIDRCAQVVESRQGDVNICHSLPPIVKVTFFRTMAEEVENKGMVSSLGPAFAVSIPYSTVIANFFLTEMVSYPSVGIHKIRSSFMVVKEHFLPSQPLVNRCLHLRLRFSSIPKRSSPLHSSHPSPPKKKQQ